MTSFGEDNPREMPGYFFSRSIRIDYETAVAADTSRQNCGVCPRYWYIDVTFPCARCGREFSFSVAEQQVWYEKYGFYVDAFPKRCQDCRRDLRRLKDLRREYDRDIAAAVDSADLAAKTRLVAVIDEMYEMSEELPERIHENRKRLGGQLAARGTSPPKEKRHL